MHERELVEMVVGGLDYSIQKRLDTQYLRGMAQLADRARQVERLKTEKVRTHKFRRENVAYVDTNESEQEFDIAYEDVEDGEINLAELKTGPPNTCKVLRPSDGKNPVETQNDRYSPKAYTFDVTKCDEIFDLLVADGQVAVPNNLKVPPLKQRKKRGYGNQQKAIFEKPNGLMKSHLKPLFVQAKVYDTRVNKVLVDGGAAVNLMSQPLLKIIGKCDADPKPHNKVFSNYEGKTGFSLGALQVNLTVGSVTRPTLFMVMPSKANFNLLLGREWIHVIGVVPSSMH